VAISDEGSASIFRVRVPKKTAMLEVEGEGTRFLQNFGNCLQSTRRTTPEDLNLHKVKHFLNGILSVSDEALEAVLEYLDCLTLDDGIDRLSRNVGNQQLTAQKREDLKYTTEED
jgi:hypothetical protein